MEDMEGASLDGHSNVIRGGDSAPQDAEDAAMTHTPSTDVKLDIRFGEKERRCVYNRCILQMVNITHHH